MLFRYGFDANWLLHIAKIIVIGQNLVCVPVDLIPTWATTPATHTFNSVGESHAFAAPAYDNDCSDDLIPYADIVFSFEDSSSSSVLSWITFDTLSSQITVTPTATEFINYHTSTLTVKIVATTTTGTILTDDTATFDLEFSSDEATCL